jgi:hypothetical protein
MSKQSFEHKIVNELHQPNGMQHVFQDLQSLRQHESQKSFHRDLNHLNHTLHKQGLLPKFEVIDASPSGFAVREKGGHQKPSSAEPTGAAADDAVADSTHGGSPRNRRRRQGQGQDQDQPSRRSTRNGRAQDELTPRAVDASPGESEAPPAMPNRASRRSGGRGVIPSPDFDGQPDAASKKELAEPKEHSGNHNGRVAFFGDSITKGMTASSEFKKNFGADVENFGHDSDTTQNLMSRLRSGQDSSKGGPPEKGVILIGTNNLGKGETDHQIAQDVLADVTEASRQNPGTKFLVVGLLPRGQSAQSPYRQHIANINRELESSLAGKSNVKFTDVGKGMLKADGNMSDRLWQSKYNYVHPTFNAGFDRLLDLIKPEVDSL